MVFEPLLKKRYPALVDSRPGNRKVEILRPVIPVKESADPVLKPSLAIFQA